MKEPDEKLSLSAFNARVIGRGGNMVRANVGEPHQPIPVFMRKAIREALKIDSGGYYADVYGIPGYCAVLAGFIKDTYGLAYAEGEILPTCGAREALSLILGKLFSPGDELIATSLEWPSYEVMAKKNGLKLVRVEVPNDFSYPLDRIEDSITPRTKGIILNSPHNPTGRSLSPEEMEELAEIAIRHNLLVISDEVYNGVNTDGFYRSIASIAGIKDRMLYVNSFSKIFAIPGWRIGYVCGPIGLIRKLAQEKAAYNGNLDTLPQHAIKIALEKYRTQIAAFIEKNNAGYRKNLAYVLKNFERLGIECIEPEGAFYVFFKIPPASGMGSERFADELLAMGVAIAPGVIFGAEWDSYMRLSFALNMKEIRLMIKKIEATIANMGTYQTTKEDKE